MPVPGLSLLGLKRIRGFVSILRYINPTIIIIIADTQIQKRLLHEKELDFKGFLCGPGYGSSSKITDIMLSGSGSSTVHALQDGPPR